MSDLATKVGKRPGVGVYVQASAIDGGRSNLQIWEDEAYRKAKKNLFGKHPDFVYDFVHISPGDTNPKRVFFLAKVRFMKMSSLFDAHPHVVESKIVDMATGEITDGKCDGKIYHRLDSIVDPTHPSYLFHQQVTKWEESQGLFSSPVPSQSIGNPKAWRAWIETKMPYDRYEHDLRLLFGQFAGNELSHKPLENSADLMITRVTGSDSGDEIHVELVDGKTHKIGIRAAFSFDQFARALTGEFGIKGRIVRWTLTGKDK